MQLNGLTYRELCSDVLFFWVVPLNYKALYSFVGSLVSQRRSEVMKGSHLPERAARMQVKECGQESVLMKADQL